jgi:putative sterol carrier protein
MPDATTDFFDRLAAQGHEPALKRVRGTLRFDLRDGKRTARWLVAIARGDVTVSRRSGKADCVVRTERALFDGVVSGEVNALAAILRGEIELEGDRGMLLPFQRLFPGPVRSRP